MILDIKEAKSKVEEIRKSGGSIGVSHGVFDLLHAGHIEHFIMCRAYCDHLFVVVSPDRFAAKGPGRPIYQQRSRGEIIDCLKVVDYVLCDEWDDETACFIIDLIKPDYYFKGTEYRDKEDLTRNIDREADLVRRHGGEIKFLSGNVSSSTNLLNRLVGSNEFRKYIKPASYYLKLLDKIEQLRVGVIGEGILDEYIRVVSLGSASKYPILSVEEIDSRVDFGGTFAIYNLLKELCNSPVLMAQGGDCPFIEGSVVKTRYTDRDKSNKLFEINKKYNLHVDHTLLSDFIRSTEIDVLLIADFGHGAFTDDVIDIVSQSFATKYLMVQHNSANRYVNFPWKYRDMDKKSFCMNRKESIVNSGQPDVHEAAKLLSTKVRSDLIFITEGRDGAICYDGHEVTRVPSVSTSIKDTIGCGDVFFTISSLVINVGGSQNDAMVMANIFAYLHAQIDGNSGVVTKNDFIRFARGLE